MGLGKKRIVGRGNHEARDVWMRLLQEEGGLPHREIGRRLGHRNGVTVGKRSRILNRDTLEAIARRARSASFSQGNCQMQGLTGVCRGLCDRGPDRMASIRGRVVVKPDAAFAVKTLPSFRQAL